jgi:NAD(P)-dependent dehydrogenase (short-subunit alcohol dehydrogenase family)
MAPSGLAILIGAGPATGTGIARILSAPTHGNLAVALLSRSQDNLESVKATVLKSNPNATLECFPADVAQPDTIDKAYSDIAAHSSFSGLKLEAAIYSVKHASKKPFLEETREAFSRALDEYVGSAALFAQLAIRRFLADHPAKFPDEDGAKKGTLIFTGTLGALRTNPTFASYGASRAGVRMLAQALAREFSPQGIHVAHAIANGGIRDVNEHAEGVEDSVKQKVKRREFMSADAVGKEYLHLVQQEPDLWTHELDLRPAMEKF